MNDFQLREIVTKGIADADYKWSDECKVGDIHFEQRRDCHVFLLILNFGPSRTW